jgi:hypothetical protein
VKLSDYLVNVRNAATLKALWRADEGIYVLIRIDTGERVGLAIPHGPDHHDAEVRFLGDQIPTEKGQ